MVVRHALNDGEVEIEILDVGHGSCVAIHAHGTLSLIDTGPNSAVLEYLRERELDAVDLVVLSHADHDHIGGLSALLSNGVHVKRVIWNTDGMKRSRIFSDLCYQLDTLEATGQTVTQVEAGGPRAIDDVAEGLSFEILAPRVRLRGLGVGNLDQNDNRIDSNSMSVVVRVVVNAEPLLVVPGDLDAVGLSHLADPWPVIHAKYLVLPHHGGTMSARSAATQDAIDRLVTAVRPEAVFVSNGRGRFENPRAEVIAGARTGRPELPIVCTQLSRNCSPHEVRRDLSGSSYATGARNGRSCAGTIRISNGQGGGPWAGLSEHQAFIAREVPGRLCGTGAPAAT